MSQKNESLVPLQLPPELLKMDIDARLGPEYNINIISAENGSHRIPSRKMCAMRPVCPHETTLFIFLFICLRASILVSIEMLR